MFDPSFDPQAVTDPSKSKHDPVPFSGLLKPDPWVLVKGGSFHNYFDWVSEDLRVGPWSPLSYVALILIPFGLVIYKPAVLSFCTSSFPPADSAYWYYNCTAAVWMGYVLGRNVSQEGFIVPFSTFTVWSWSMLLIRHAISAIAPFLAGSRLLVVGEVLRCPALLNAAVVFVVWNFILAPGIYVTMETAEKRQHFRKWLVQFNLLNQHGLNLPLAVCSCVLSSPRPLTNSDIWFGVCTVAAYLAFYLLVLDRLGVHLYPVFSPRNRWSGLVWMAVVLGYWGLFTWVQGWVSQFASDCA